MLTSKIETFADVGGIAQPDVDLKAVLRHKVVPEFLQLVGYPSWRRKTASIILKSDGTQAYDLPDDFGSMKEAALSDSYKPPLTYIGDDPAKLMAAEAAASERTKPSGYCLVRRATSELFKRIKFNCPPDQAYTCRFVYYNTAVFTDDTTAVDMDMYIPAHFQWGLIEGLKAYLYGVRRGIGDDRKADAENEFAKYVALASENPELSSGGKPRFVS